MSKKRKTRQEKIKASFQTPTFSFVKREFDQNLTSLSLKGPSSKSKENSTQIDFSASIKFDILKTFILASFIFAAEAMLYWLWK